LALILAREQVDHFGAVRAYYGVCNDAGHGVVYRGSKSADGVRSRAIAIDGAAASFGVALLFLAWRGRGCERSRNDDVNQSVHGFMAENPDDVREKAENLRAQASRCRRLARQTTDRDIARRLLELAQEFELRALELEAKRCI
jgi:hypothetical protein